MITDLGANHFVLAIGPDWNLSLTLSALLFAIVAFVFLALIVVPILLRIVPTLFTGTLQIDEAQLGIGDQRIRIRPDHIDRQIAYRIWVELSTRKIGLPIDLEHDVITEVYDSWYSFFSVTRELIKDIPVQHVRRHNTGEIVRLSIDVLNHGLRPHLTRWQARFRRWYVQTADKAEFQDMAPQDIQAHYPEYTQLRDDLLAVNGHLIAYRKAMYDLVTKV